MTAEIDKQCHSEFRRFEVVQCLGFFSASQMVECFQFNDNLLVTDEIRNLLLLEFMPLVEDSECALGFERD